MVTKQHKLSERSDQEKHLTPIYGRTATDRPIPKYELPEDELAPEVAYNLIHDELMLDATFLRYPCARRLLASHNSLSWSERPRSRLSPPVRPTVRNHENPGRSGSCIGLRRQKSGVRIPLRP